MKKLLSLLLVATIITSTLCVSYFAFDNVDNLSNITTSEPTEKEIEPSTTSTSDEATTEPSSTDENTTITSTEPSSSISTPDEPTTESSTIESSTEPTTTEPTDIKVSSIKLNTKNHTMYSNQYVQLKATVLPNNAYNKSVTWKSSNSKIATVDKNGKVKAIKVGNAIITATSTDGSNVSAQCKIKVVQRVTKIKLNKSIINLSKKGKTAKLKATVSPNNAYNKSVTWKANNTKVVTVDKKGKIKATTNKGATYVNAIAKDGSKKKAKVLVVVGPKVQKITLNKTSVTLNRGAKNRTFQLKKAIKNKNATYKGVSWYSSNKNVATVNSNGKVTIKHRGKVVITVKAKDGSKKSAKCKVTVRQLVTKLSYNKKTQKAEVYKNKTIKFAVTVAPSNANNKGLTYSSSNKKVATVNSKGVIKGIKAGTVTITAKAKDGSRKAVKLTVKVKNPPVTMHTKMTREQFVSNKKYVDMYCKALNDYFESCGAYIDYNMKYVDEGQWCVISSDMFDDGDSIYDFMVGTVGLWTWRIAYDRLSSDKDPDLVETCQSWKNFRSLNKEAEDFLDEVNRVSSPNLKTYNPKKMLDMNWNGWKWYCDLIKSWGTGEDYMLHIYVKAEPIKAYDSSIQKVTTVYRIKMYWG